MQRRVEFEWCTDRLRGTRRDTPRATAATIFPAIRFDLDGRDDLAQEDPVAELAADEVRVLADEAEAGPLRQIALEQRAGVDVEANAPIRRRDELRIRSVS